MTDKNKTMKELLEEVKFKSQSILEKENHQKVMEQNSLYPPHSSTNAQPGSSDTPLQKIRNWFFSRNQSSNANTTPAASSTLTRTMTPRNLATRIGPTGTDVDRVVVTQNTPGAIPINRRGDVSSINISDENIDRVLRSSGSFDGAEKQIKKTVQSDTAGGAGRVISRTTAWNGSSTAVPRAPAPAGETSQAATAPRTAAASTAVPRAPAANNAQSKVGEAGNSAGAPREPSVEDMYASVGKDSQSAAPKPREPDLTPQGIADRTRTGTNLQSTSNPPPPPPRPAARPAAPAPRPAAPAPRPAPDPNATSRAMFQRMSDKGDDATSADFFRADAQRTRELRSQRTNEETKMSSPMIQAFLKLQEKNSHNLFSEAKKKRLDPVGKEDGDIDNDGDTDKSDQYLHNRRKAIGKAIREAGDEGTAGSVVRNGRTSVSPTAPGGAGYKKEGPSDKEREALTNKIKDIQKKDNDKIVKEDMKRDPGDTMGAGNRLGRRNPVKLDREKDAAMKVIAMKNASAESDEPAGKITDRVPSDKPYGDLQGAKKAMANEEVEQIDEVLDKAKDKIRYAQKAADQIDNVNPYGSDKKDDKILQKRRKGILMLKRKVERGGMGSMDEDVEFSDAELEHFASILEMSVAPTPDDYSGSRHGVSKRDLSDETIVETKKKDPSELKQRGRKAGVKVGAYKMKGMDDVEGDEAKAEPKNLVAQNPRTYNKEGRNLVDLEHPSKPGVKRTVPAKEYDSFRSSYLNAEKPEHKTKMHDAYVKRVFN